MANMPMVLRNTMPDQVSSMVELLAKYDANEAVTELTKRHAETRGFTSDAAAFLAGIAMVPDARKRLEQEIDSALTTSSIITLERLRRKSVAAPEVVIGSGVHAAIYCAVRRKMGHPRPVVIEQQPRIGGSFAMTKSPAFYLNSRNRPGKLTVPGDDGGGLNVIPEAPVQPCDLSASEYQRNSDVAFAVRMTLMMHSTPVVNVQVSGVSGTVRDGVKYFVNLVDGRSIPTSRVIDASGLGVPREIDIVNGETILSYSQFMQRLDTPFPFKGMRKVAVVGGGDSGKTVVEALVGQGPGSGWSTAAMDWIDRIDWWGETLTTTGDEWQRCNRSRYRGLARFMPLEPNAGRSKIRPIVRAASDIQPGYNCAYVDGEAYDCAVICKGFKPVSSPISSMYAPSYIFRGIGESARRIGLTYGSEDNGLYGVGPVGRIPLSNVERTLYGQVAENGTAIFRLADRTAMVAATT